MKINKCKQCGLDVAQVKTKRGKAVTSEVYWDGNTGEFKVYTKNHQPTPHTCSNIRRKNG